MSNSIRNHEEIAEEVAKLQDLRTKVPPKTAFGDSNHAAIDAQIEVLNRDMSDNAIYRKWEDDERVVSNAQEARAWLDGDAAPPSKEWEPLAGVVVKPIVSSPFGFDEEDDDEDDWDDDEDEDEEDWDDDEEDWDDDE